MGRWAGRVARADRDSMDQTGLGFMITRQSERSVSRSAGLKEVMHAGLREIGTCLAVPPAIAG